MLLFLSSQRNLPWMRPSSQTKSAPASGRTVAGERVNCLTLYSSTNASQMHEAGTSNLTLNSSILSRTIIQYCLRLIYQMLQVSLQDIILKLISAKESSYFREVKLLEAEITALCTGARLLIGSQPMLVELQAPLKICGDIHGQYLDLLRIFQFCGFPPSSNYLFLGDYVDRGKNSIETMCLLLAFKLKYPQNFFLLRGNHESSSVTRIYGFYEQCKRRYSLKLWKTFCDLFNMLPVAALVSGKIFCVHGGISPQLTQLRQIHAIKRPVEVQDKGLLCDLLWSDPDQDVQEWQFNEERGISFSFGKKAVGQFLKANRLDLICRAHQVAEQGYQFFANKQLVTIFSAPNYMGKFENLAVVLNVAQNLMCSFQVLKGVK